MKNSSIFSVKILTLYVIIFISFLAKTYTIPNFHDLVTIAHKTISNNYFAEIINNPLKPHQAR
ncbi:hypothetical protein CHU_2722 [Cytophaga hutchinsonii ATCC 33406]|uniref:Uncharacterized protein n=1 Tax=Cytophaga hutchinsonii (strain ATCC 33406 / DSM 1761 / CIP 103989 / NBRC 15051 / NCIMB 9469 / D465) TaxID=269798 RepID=A0A6N4SUR5_CYTH3|nr:hypothetical protein CHU_2722 [Cytophaga hutchinsonii ATCC 33406]